MQPSTLPSTDRQNQNSPVTESKITSVESFMNCSSANAAPLSAPIMSRMRTPLIDLIVPYHHIHLYSLITVLNQMMRISGIVYTFIIIVYVYNLPLLVYIAYYWRIHLYFALTGMDLVTFAFVTHVLFHICDVAVYRRFRTLWGSFQWRSIVSRWLRIPGANKVNAACDELGLQFAGRV